ncbi:MAG TPA: hypothetical protein VNM48_06330, partial [Chloroflexota bacterium]|nr:hypothetical protein [Chloroflexota bacterium]
MSTRTPVPERTPRPNGAPARQAVRPPVAGNVSRATTGTPQTPFPRPGVRPTGRQTAVSREARRDGRAMAFGWGDHLTRAEKDRLRSRFAFLGLSAVLALVLVLIGGTLLWEKVYTARRAIARVDGSAVTLQAFANLLSYEQNRLEAAFLDASQLAGRPPPPGADPSQNMLAQMGQQRMQQIQQRLSSLSSALPEEIIDELIIRSRAKERGLTATPEEVDGQIRELVGYQDPNATPVPTAVATASSAITSSATPVQGAQAPEPPAATVA